MFRVLAGYADGSVGTGFQAMFRGGVTPPEFQTWSTNLFANCGEAFSIGMKGALARQLVMYYPETLKQYGYEHPLNQKLLKGTTHEQLIAWSNILIQGFKEDNMRGLPLSLFASSSASSGAAQSATAPSGPLVIGTAAYTVADHLDNQAKSLQLVHQRLGQLDGVLSNFESNQAVVRSLVDRLNQVHSKLDLVLQCLAINGGQPVADVIAAWVASSGAAVSDDVVICSPSDTSMTGGLARGGLATDAFVRTFTDNLKTVVPKNKQEAKIKSDYLRVKEILKAHLPNGSKIRRRPTPIGSSDDAIWLGEVAEAAKCGMHGLSQARPGEKPPLNQRSTISAVLRVFRGIVIPVNHDVDDDYVPPPPPPVAIMYLPEVVNQGTKTGAKKRSAGGDGTSRKRRKAKSVTSSGGETVVDGGSVTVHSKY
jgi:hypothetical protein